MRAEAAISATLLDMMLLHARQQRCEFLDRRRARANTWHWQRQAPMPSRRQLGLDSAFMRRH